jgi:outer membrane receptor for ferrienterochelin and colicin
MRLKVYVAMLLWMLLVTDLRAQDLDSLLNLNAFTAESELQKLLNKNVSVSAQKLTTRETPGILSVITAEEIQNSGARDMIDVLRLVPGFDVLQDLQFVTGIGFRGNWANEGKVLVMMDGQPFNELLYQTVALGNRFPVDAIERIEIIRGPGSAIYGGSAEYGVINIITKAAESLDGVAVYGVSGFHNDAIGRLNAGIMAAQKGEKLSWDFSAFKGKGIVSDQMYQDIYEELDPQDLSKKAHSNPMNLSAGIRYKNLSLRTMYDAYETADPQYDVSYKSFYLDGSYGIQVSEKFKLTPRIQYIDQTPWKYAYFNEVEFDVRAKRILTEVDGKYDISRKVNLNFGALYFEDHNQDQIYAESDLTLNNIAVYAQALLKHRLVNATVGFRFEKNNRYSGAFVPRVALTKKIENFHFKALASRSFRAPSLQNILLHPTGAKPEKSTVLELELGYQFTPEMLLAVNAFHITTNDILIYGSQTQNDEFEEWYENYNKAGSKGIELVYSIRKKNWYSNVTYSYSEALTDNTVDIYRVPQTTKQYVGMSRHKFTLNTNVNLSKHLNINPTITTGSKRYAFTALDADEEPVATALDPYVLVNIFMNYRNIVPGLTLGAGVYDIFNERPGIAQAYHGGESTYKPIPGRSREYVVKLSYQINFKK